MTDLEQALAAGGKPAQSDLEAALAAGGKVSAEAEHKPSLYERFKEGVSGAGRTLKGFGKTAVNDIISPIGRTILDPGRLADSGERDKLANDFILTNPAKRRQLERGLSDTITFGLAENVANRFDPSLKATAEQDAKDAPDERSFGQVAGMASPGGATLLAKGAGKLIGKTLGGVAAKGAIPGAALGAAKATLGYEATAPLAAGAQAANAGKNPIEAARQAATDPFGLVLSGGIGAVSGSGQGYAGKLRDPSTLEGRTLRDVEAAGGTIKAVGEPVRGGEFESPELAGLPKGRAGVNQLASESTGRTIDANQKRYEAAQDAWGHTADQILAAHGSKRFPAQVTHSVLDAIDQENTVNGVIGDPKVAAAVQKARDMLTTTTNKLNAQASAVAQKPIYMRAAEASVADFIKARKVLNRIAKHTTEPSERYAFGKVLDAMKDDAAAIDPRIGELNANYRETMQSLSGANDALFGKNKPVIKDTESTRQTGAGRLGRVGDDTQAGTLAEPRMAKFEASSPEAAREVRLNRAKKAMERLRYGEPEVSTSIEKGMGRAVKGAAKRVVAAAVGGAVAGPLGAAAGHVVGMPFENPMALRLRVGLPVAESVGRFGGAPGSVAARLFLARQRQQEQNAGRAAALGGQ